MVSHNARAARFVARYESETGTVAVHDKLRATDSHTPVESASVGSGLAGTGSQQFTCDDLDDR